jgi:uncharacterized membrane protein
MEYSDILKQLLSNAQSRKFLLPIGYAVFIYLNHTQDWGVPSEQVMYVGAGVGLFLLVEGVADVVTRLKQ